MIYKNTKYSSPKVLFIVKERKVYGTKTKCYGLFNSCDFIARTLREMGIEAKTIQVIDNNCIDRAVSEFKPTHCFIEALWVVPSKFEILAKLHPQVKWSVRIHSMVPFLASEGIAFEWIEGYLDIREKGIDLSISCNNSKLHRDLTQLYGNSITYTPNIYNPISTIIPQKDKNKIAKSEEEFHIGCFGALRILKNQAQQAIWAIEFAESIGKTLVFHINVSEHEQKEAGPVLKNIKAIFNGTKHRLYEHSWYEHSDFLDVVRQMDMGMQVSFTETFNIVTADFVYCGIPIVVSKDISFINPLCRCDPSNTKSVLNSMFWGRRFGDDIIKLWNKWLLKSHNRRATKEWVNVLCNH